MRKIPTLDTPRLILRPFKLEDAPIIAELGNDKDIATNTENLPFPYEEPMARQWIACHDDMYEHGTLLNLAIVLRKQNKLMGAIGFDFNYKYDHAELGYWLGRPYWGVGYATEAARRMLHYGFMDLNLHRIHSCHLTITPISGRVLQKVGMQHEGCFRGHIKKWGEYLDLEHYGILREEYLQRI
ncbi:MAG: GNAT family N-acetyltransferase [Gammaproteobacteria bacterium]